MNTPPITEEALIEARRARDLLLGAAALVRRGNEQTPVGALIGEARATLERVIDALERFFVVELERQRNLHSQASKHVGQEPR